MEEAWASFAKIQDEAWDELITVYGPRPRRALMLTNIHAMCAILGIKIQEEVQKGKKCTRLLAWRRDVQVAGCISHGAADPVVDCIDKYI